MPPALHVQTLPTTPSKLYTNGTPFITPSASPRSVPPSHSHNSLPKSPYHPPSLHPSHIPDASSSHRTAFVPSVITSTTHTPSSHRTIEYVNDLRIYARSPLSSDIVEEVRTNGSSPWPSNHIRSDSDQMDVSFPLAEIPEDSHAMDAQTSPISQPILGHIPVQDTTHTTTSKLGRFGSLGFGKKTPRWSLGVFGHGEKLHQQPLPPVDEVPGSSSTPSLKRTQSTNSDSLSAADASPANARKDAKAIKREAERLQLEAEKQRRALAERSHREQARAVMQKRNQMLKQTTGRHELEWKWSHSGSLLNVNQRPNYGDLDHGKISASGPIRQNQSNGKISSPTLNAASGRYLKPPDTNLPSSDRWLPSERSSKVRRRDFGDDHSMSSSDVHSTGRTSVMSSATVDSDPGPTRVRRPAIYGINRMTSASSLRTGRTSYDDFPTSARSSNSMSLDHQFNEFNIRASVDTTSSVSGTSSPPPINLLSLSPSPNSWRHSHNSHESTSPYVVPSLIQYPPSSHKSYECNGQLYGHPPTDLIDAHSTINPIFKVVRGACHLVAPR